MSLMLRLILTALLLPLLVRADFFREGKPPYLEGVSQAKLLPDFRELSKELIASVVNVRGDKLAPASSPVANKGRSSGSGFVVSEDGYIVTNYHVVSKLEKINVYFLNEKRKHTAKLIAFDSKTDLALLKIDTTRALRPLYFGDSDKLQVGEWVLAIGNQFQLGQTITAGIVSAKSRKLNMRQTGPYDNFIQTDASINPGSSGGPLFNIQGQVVGVNTAIFSPGRNTNGTGFNVGVGFAIPINQVKKIIRQLKNKGNVTRGMLGVIIQGLDENLAEAMGIESLDGALVAEVLANTPAAKIGIQPKDLLLSFNGRRIREYSSLPGFVAETEVGTKATLEVLRSNRRIKLYPTITELKDNSLPAESLSQDLLLEPDSLGLIVRDLDSFIIQKHKLKFKHGVHVESILPGSAATDAGLRRGDILIEFNGKRLRSVDDYNDVVENLPTEQASLVIVHRKDGRRILAIRKFND